MKLAALLLTLLAFPAMAAGVYRWTDADQGIVHYTDQPPASPQNTSLKTYKSAMAGGNIRPQVQQAGLNNPIIVPGWADHGS